MAAPDIPQRPAKKGALRCLAVRIVVFLLLGAVVNVAVAWGIALWHSANPTPGVVDRGYTASHGSVHHWFLTRERDFGVERFESYWIDDSCELTITFGRMPEVQATTLLPRWARTLDPTRTELYSGQNSALLEAFGWPALSLWAGTRSLVPCNVSSNAKVVVDVNGLGIDSANPNRLLPTLPVWPGFAFNTIFYAVILWMLFAAQIALRRRRRMRKGLCPKCAYPIGESDACTECGAAVKRISEATNTEEPSP